LLAKDTLHVLQEKEEKFSIQINHQPDATVFQFIILMFIYSSTRFGHFPAHHQELNDCSGSLWFYLCIGPTMNTARLSPRYEGNKGKKAETRFRLSAKSTSPFKSAGESVQSTTGSRCVRINGSNAGYNMF
jgi:hypothetical protein